MAGWISCRDRRIKKKKGLETRALKAVCYPHRYYAKTHQHVSQLGGSQGQILLFWMLAAGVMASDLFVTVSCS